MGLHCKRLSLWKLSAISCVASVVRSSVVSMPLMYLVFGDWANRSSLQASHPFLFGLVITLSFLVMVVLDSFVFFAVAVYIYEYASNPIKVVVWVVWSVYFILCVYYQWLGQGCLLGLFMLSHLCVMCLWRLWERDGYKGLLSLEKSNDVENVVVSHRNGFLGDLNSEISKLSLLSDLNCKRSNLSSEIIDPNSVNNDENGPINK